MLYTTQNLPLWPRLIFAADLLDPEMGKALRQLAEQGADLSLKDSAKAGGKVFALSRGTITEEQYRQTVGTPGEPRYPLLGKAVARARTTPHPWITAVQTAYADLDRRCKEQAQEMRALPKVEAFAKVPALIDRHLQAWMLAGILTDAGMCDPYEKAAVAHAEEAKAMLEAKHANLLKYDRTRNLAWLMETPDGWIWVTPDPKVKPAASGESEEWQEKAPVVSSAALTEALRALDGETVPQREAG